VLFINHRNDAVQRRNEMNARQTSGWNPDAVAPPSPIMPLVGMAKPLKNDTIMALVIVGAFVLAAGVCGLESLLGVFW
jgi:hypothetical protein